MLCTNSSPGGNRYEAYTKPRPKAQTQCCCFGLPFGSKAPVISPLQLELFCLFFSAKLLCCAAACQQRIICTARDKGAALWGVYPALPTRQAQGWQERDSGISHQVETVTQNQSHALSNGKHSKTSCHMLTPVNDWPPNIWHGLRPAPEWQHRM